MARLFEPIADGADVGAPLLSSFFDAYPPVGGAFDVIGRSPSSGKLTWIAAR
jgi:hypothetical protein